MQTKRGINRRYFLQLAALAGSAAALRTFPVHAKQEPGKAASEQTEEAAQTQIDTITISIFDLLKIGPGPSSSHTIGPMKAADNFIETIEKRQGLKVGCLEEIAYKKGYIDAEQVEKLAESLNNSDYGKYLFNMLKFEEAL